MASGESALVTKENNSGGVNKQEELEEEDSEVKALYALYLSRGLAAWGDRLWQFVGSLFMLSLDPGSLQLVAVYGLASCLTVLVCGAGLGALVDRTSRMRMVTCTVVMQNVAVALTCMLVFFFFNTSSLNSTTRLLLAGLAVFLSILSYLSSIAARLAVEKDWLVCLCAHDTSLLAKVNANVRTIDLTCNLAAPLLAGQLLYFWSYSATAVVLCGWVMVSATLELWLLWLLYQSNRRLQSKDTPNRQEAGRGILLGLRDTWQGWKSFMLHPVRDAGLGLALLYMTVLGFDNITWGFCILQGVSESVLGALTGVSAVVGILGARLFPVLCKRLGLDRTGLVGFTLLSACLAISVSSVWSPGSPFAPITFLTENNHSHILGSSHDQVHTVLQQNEDQVQQNDSVLGKDYVVDSLTSVTLLLIGIISGRFGLWIADLSVQQIFQENVAEEERGVLFGVQTGLQSGMDLMKFLLVIGLPHQHSFGILIIASFLFVSCGGLFFLRFCICRNRHESFTPLLQN